MKVADRAAGSTDNARVGSDGRWSQADRPALDWSGRSVAFSSGEPLVVDDTNAVPDVRVRDRACPTSRRVPAGIGGAQPDGGSDWPAMSGDGRYVAYISSATNLVPGDTNDAVDLYRGDRVAGTTVRASLSTSGRSGIEPNDPSISADADVVAFDWRAPYDDGTFGAQREAWVRDLRAGTSETVTSTQSLPPMANFDRQLVLGSLRGQWRFFAGELDEVAVYDGALGPARIAAHHAAATAAS